MKNPNEHEFGHERVKTAQQRVITYSGRGWDGVSVLAPSPLRAPLSSWPITWISGHPQNCAPCGTKFPRTSGWGGCPTGIVGGAGAPSGCLRKRCSAVRITLVLTRFRGIRGVLPRPRCGRTVAAHAAVAGQAVAAAQVGRLLSWLRPAVGGLRPPGLWLR